MINLSNNRFPKTPIGTGKNIPVTGKYNNFSVPVKIAPHNYKNNASKRFERKNRYSIAKMIKRLLKAIFSMLCKIPRDMRGVAIFIFIIGIICILLGIMAKTNADNSIADRIKECDVLHVSRDAIIQCVMIREIKTADGIMKVSSFRKTREEVGKMYDEMNGGNLLKDTMSFISDFEGFRECAYKDGAGRYSIGYGTKSYKGECITKEEAIKRKKGHIEPIIAKIPSCFTYNQKIALTSYIYNTGGNQLNLPKFVKNCDKKNVLYVMGKYGHGLKGLKKRRGIEILKFNQK